MCAFRLPCWVAVMVGPNLCCLGCSCLFFVVRLLKDPVLYLTEVAEGCVSGQHMDECSTRQQTKNQRYRRNMYLGRLTTRALPPFFLK